MASKYGSWDDLMKREVDAEAQTSGMAHKVKWMSDEGPMENTNHFQRPGEPGTGDTAKVKGSNK